MKPKFVKKPWGYEIWFAHTPKYTGKIIFVKKGCRLSLQYHRFKHETFFADRGSFMLSLNGRSRKVRPGQSIEVKPRMIHRVEARFGDIRIIEVSTSQLKDIVRVEDDYGRKGKQGR